MLAKSAGETARLPFMLVVVRAVGGGYRMGCELPSQLAYWLWSFQNKKSLVSHSARSQRFLHVNLCTLRNSVVGSVIKSWWFHILWYIPLLLEDSVNYTSIMWKSIYAFIKQYHDLRNLLRSGETEMNESWLWPPEDQSVLEKILLIEDFESTLYLTLNLDSHSQGTLLWSKNQRYFNCQDSVLLTISVSSKVIYTKSTGSMLQCPNFKLLDERQLKAEEFWIFQLASKDQCKIPVQRDENFYQMVILGVWGGKYWQHVLYHWYFSILISLVP